jgi:hypothetical protein
MKIRATLTSVAAAGALLTAGAIPAAADPVEQDGLVNVNLGDVTAQLPIGIAANVCDLSVNALAEQISLGDNTCDAVAEPVATNPGNGQGPVNQEGLVNVNAGDITIQVPVAIAANICDVDVNVLARQLGAGDVECDAAADAVADNA